MASLFRAAYLVCAATAIVAVVIRSPQGASGTGPHPASADEVATLAELVERAEYAIFLADVTGDPSSFPTVFYNDATVQLHPEYGVVLSRVSREDVRLALDAAAPDPVGDETGLLSAYTAIVLDNERSRDAWAEEEEKAAQEGRAPSAENMPGFEVPRPRHQWSDWGWSPRSLFAVMIDGEHATAWVAYEDLAGQPADYMPDPAMRYVFTRVEGQWYVSNLEMVPGPNVPIGELVAE
ncbi:MAG: hypothetical protein DCC58_11775 [Chloroflexi bacterium]|nr:MAG: hypothetical protein DCC58_11775 [Chloroflexota bacterium]